MIGFMEESKTLNEAVDFNKDNIFEYIFFIHHSRNADKFGKTATPKQEKIIQGIYSSNMGENERFELESLLTETMCDVSEYAYKSGFIDACKLMHTLNSF